MNQSSSFIQIHPEDSVIISLREFKQGEQIQLGNQVIDIRTDIPLGHKIAVKAISKQDNIIKFGYPIGHARMDIQAGDWVHTHNVHTNLSDVLDYTYTPLEGRAVAATASDRTFQGYVRANGEVGIRNEIWVLTTVGCINKTAEALVKRANREFADRQLDGIFHYPHPYGCSQLGDDLVYTQKILRSLANHPNAAGVLIMGLGCENNYMELFQSFLHEIDQQRMKFMVVQESRDEMDEGMAKLSELVQYAEQFKREPVSVSHLKMGMKCGGSDGFSGITANPLVGSLSDQIVAHGGTSILTEVPEMFGAETLLMNRSINEQVYDKTVHLINGFKEYYKRYNQVIYENPSPGNKQGGITTLEEKSLGCVQKGGHSPICGVHSYGERVMEAGLHLVEGPGNDLVSVTALVAAGAHIVCFTTGRGTPFGGPVPTVKISTNSALAERKPGWIDFDAGRLLTGQSMTAMTAELMDYLIDLASGVTRTNNEKNEHKEIAIFKDGVTL